MYLSLKENIYTTEESRRNLAKQIVGESVVMLENDGILPLPTGTYAMIGRAMYRPALGGMGSGMSFLGKEVPDFVSALEAVGLKAEKSLHEYYQAWLTENPMEDPFAEFMKAMEENPNLVASGAIYDLFGNYSPQEEEIPVPITLLEQTARCCDTAILAFSRNTGGEECDRYLENDFYLLDGEKELICNVCKVFQRVVVLVNTNGVTDLTWMKENHSISAVLMVGAGGEMAPAAIADLLIGKESPSGKLAFTIAASYEDYSTAKDFSCDKKNSDSILEYKDYGLDAAANGSIGFAKSPVTVYKEGLYMGYRYFDSFGLDVLYPFGFGLSYAEFSITDTYAVHHWEREELEICARVRNLSQKYSGKEALQLYVSAPQGNLEQPYQGLKGFTKTPVLQPGESCNVSIRVPLRELASYEERTASWVLEAGDYLFRLGSSSRNTRIAATLHLPEKIVSEKVSNRLGIQECNQGKINFLSAKGKTAIRCGGCCDAAAAERIECTPELLSVMIHEENSAQDCGTAVGEKTVTLQDVAKGQAVMPQLTAQLTDEELMALCVGYGPGIPFADFTGEKEAPATIQDEQGNDLTVNTHPTGAVGYVSPSIEKYGIPSACYKDGPASCGKTAWPTAMTMACCFNPDLFYAFGSACAKEAEEQGIDSWLAPALNLHRNPIGGRNFEYYSEDPYLAGICGIYICRGAAETTDVTCCLKHLALNEQETYRRGSGRKSIDAVDSIVSERTARELYLKPFEMTIKYAPVRTVMTAFNKINGKFCAGSKDLNTEILRNEWGYQGVVVTDWGDMDIVVDGADAVAAGNDVVMPGGPPVIRQIAQGYQEGRVTRKELEQAVGNLLRFVMQSGSFYRYKNE